MKYRSELVLKKVAPLLLVAGIGSACTSATTEKPTPHPEPSATSHEAFVNCDPKAELNHLRDLGNLVFRNDGVCVGLVEPATQTPIGDSIRTGETFRVICRDDATKLIDIEAETVRKNAGNARIAQPQLAAWGDLYNGLPECSSIGNIPLPSSTPANIPPSPLV